MNAQDRPGKSERRAAARRIDQACATGRIIAADRDLRLQQLDGAQTNTELAVLLRDLGPEPAPAAYAGPRPGRDRSRSLKLVPVVVALVLVGAVVTSAVGFLGATDVTTDTRAEPVTSAKADALTTDGYGGLAGALREATSGTLVSRAVIYPEYAVLDVPTGDGRSTYYRWDGTLTDGSTRDDSGERGTVDLTDFRPAMLRSLVATARRELVPDATTTYIVLQPSLTDDAAVIYAYASKGARGGYVAARVDGTIVRKVRF